MRKKSVGCGTVDRTSSNGLSRPGRGIVREKLVSKKLRDPKT